MSDQTKVINIAVELCGTTRDKALKIKEELGVKSWAEMLRYLITDFHRRQIAREEK